MIQSTAQAIPRKVCPVTGLVIHPFPFFTRPFSAPGGWLVNYWRADGVLIQTRRATTAEIAWIVDNPGLFKARQTRMDAWLARKKSNG